MIGIALVVFKHHRNKFLLIHLYTNAPAYKSNIPPIRGFNFTDLLYFQSSYGTLYWNAVKHVSLPLSILLQPWRRFTILKTNWFHGLWTWMASNAIMWKGTGSECPNSQNRPKQDLVTTCPRLQRQLALSLLVMLELEISNRPELTCRSFYNSEQHAHAHAHTRAHRTASFRPRLTSAEWMPLPDAIVSRLSFASFPSRTKVIHHDSIKLWPLAVDEWPGLPVKPWPPSSFTASVG